MKTDDLRPHLIIGEAPKVRIREYEGGGSTYPRKSYSEHAVSISRNAEQLKAIFAKATAPASKKQVSRLYYRVELPKDQSVLTTTGDKLEKDLHAKLMASPEKNVGYVSTSPDGFSMLLEQLTEYKNSVESTGKSKFAILESIGPIPPEEKISSLLQDNEAFKLFNGQALVTIFPDLTRGDQDLAKKEISDYLATRGGEVLDSYSSEDGLIIRVNLQPKMKTLTDLAEAFPMVQSIDPVEEVIETSSVIGDPLPANLEVAKNPGAAAVCIFDSGVIKNSPLLNDSIIGHEEPIGPPLSHEHGTFVASRIIYGDSLRDQIASGKLSPDVKVLSVCMVSHDAIGNRVPAKGEGFLKILRDTVTRWHKKIKVYNLSMNLVLAGSQAGALVTDDSVSPVAAEIDKLSKEFDVLFVLTTGNIPITPAAPVPTEPYPEYFKKDDARLCRPAEAMLALTVGSIAVRENEGAMAKTLMPSPFTRRGPGFAGYRKPDISAHGGNLTKQWKPFNDLSTAGLSSDGKHIAYGNGTSYAAPLISRLAALLFPNLHQASANLVRAMLIHFTSLPKELKWDEKNVVQLLGNGLIDSSRLLASNRWDQSFLFQGKIKYREILELPFYVPQELLARRGRHKLRVKVTIVFSPETSRVLKRGYCKSHLQTKIQKLTASGRIADVAVGHDTDVISDKYSTIIRCNREFSAGVKGGDWRLIIEHKSRWKLREEETPFAAIVSVIDPRSDSAVDISSMIKIAVPNRYKAATKISERIRV